jgi:lysophospholipase L1-like esterase
MSTYESLSWLRTYQLLHYVIYPPRAPAASLDFHALVRLTRVPPTYFVDNVDAMIRLADQRGVPILFIAPPFGAGLTNPANDVLFPAQLIPSVHALYRDLLRGVVARHSDTVGLVDFSPPEFDAPLMSTDGIHPTELGYARIAEAVTRPLALRLSKTIGASPAADVGRLKSAE